MPTAAAIAVATATASPAAMPQRKVDPAVHKDVTELAHELKAKTSDNPPAI